jgi:hypothetical protein
MFAAAHLQAAFDAPHPRKRRFLAIDREDDIDQNGKERE